MALQTHLTRAVRHWCAGELRPVSVSVNRSLWKNLFDEKSFPGLPCPQCETGKLKLVEGSFSRVEPKFSKQLHKHDDWEPDWVTNRFSARMNCDEENCREIVAISGDTEMVQVYLDEDDGYEGWALDEALRPQSVFPAPPLFKIPRKTPGNIRKQLDLAFQFFWTDLSSSVGRLRTAVELILDDQKVPKEKKTKKGKTVRMDLAERIEAYAASAEGDDAKEALHGLRYLGNLGTHGGSVAKEAVFDAADVLEDVILGVYEKMSIKAKIKKLNEKKGDY